MKRETLDLAQEYFETIGDLDRLLIDIKNSRDMHYPIVHIKTSVDQISDLAAKFIRKEEADFVNSLITKLEELKQDCMEKFEAL